MPDSYQNPPYKPPTRPYQWVPNTTPTGGDTPFGFSPTTIERGQFRNDVPVMEGFPGGTLTCTFTGNLESSEGSEVNPILAVFRPKVNPDGYRIPPPAEGFVVKGADLSWKAEMSQAAIISAITIEYALSVDINDASLRNYLSAEDADLLTAYQQNPTGEPPEIDWSKYKFGQILGVASDGAETEYPAPVNGESSELEVTGITDDTKSHTVKLADGFTSSSFPTLKAIKLKNRVGFTGLKLTLKKFMIFEAERVNLRDEQLPCALLEYAFPVRFAFNPTTNVNIQRLPFPADSANPNFHFKLFTPDERIATTGMAHSINLRFFVASIPLTFIDPIALIGGPTSLFMAIFIGPAPGRKTMVHVLTGAKKIGGISNAFPGMVVPLDNEEIQEATTTVRLEKIASDSEIPAPDQNANWVRVEDSTYSISSPPSFEPEGPFVSEYLFYDADAKSTHWYRTVQVTSSQAEYYSSAFKAQHYSERMAFKALQESVSSTSTSQISRRVKFATDYPQGNPLIEDGINHRPLAFFVSEGDFDVSSPVSFRKGPFKFKFRAKINDESFNTPTHLFVRFWLVPSEQSLDLNSIYQYRPSTELHFETSTETTKLVVGAPRSMADLIVSPPLTTEFQDIELVRYIDETLTATPPFSPSKLVAAVYVTSYLSEDGTLEQIDKNTPNLPKVTLDLNNSWYLETTNEKVESNIIFAQRASRFTSSRYTEIDKPLIVTSKKVSGGTLPDDQAFPLYEGKFLSNVDNAFADLITLESVDNEAAKFYIPVNTVPTEVDDEQYVYADFCTNGLPLDSGRILDGEWTVEMDLHTAVDNQSINYDARIEAFLVDGHGVVRERIFRSKRFEAIRNGGSLNPTYNITVTFPMIITGTDTQLVLRVIAYPYSASGSAININEIKNSLGAVPFGFRVNSISLTEHTASRQTITQVSSFLGSPAYYEDLPLIPTRSIGESPDFWFIVSDFLTNVVIVEGQNGLDMTGCLYSPAWFLNCPKGMETRIGAQGFSDRDVWFRTVLADATAAGEQGVSAVEDKRTGTSHVAYAKEDTAAGQSVGALADETVIRHSSFDSPFFNAHQSSDVAGKEGEAVTKLKGKNPNLQFLRTGLSKRQGEVLGLVSQYDEGENIIARSAITTTSGGQGSWVTPHRDFGMKNFSSVQQFTKGLQLPALAQSELGTLVYAAGYSDPGTILLKEGNIFDSSSGNVAEGPIWIVDGDPNITAAESGQIVRPSYLSNLKAATTFPGVMVDESQRVTVAYVLEGNSGRVMARTLLGGQEWTNPYTIVDMRPQSSASRQLDITSPALYWHRTLGTGFCAFCAAGKIFIAPVQTAVSSSGVLVYPAQLVAGSRDFSSQGNEFGPTLQALVDEHKLRNEQLGTAEQDVPSQRVGMFVSDQWPFQNNIFIYYRGNDDEIYVRRVVIGGKTGAAKKIS